RVRRLAALAPIDLGAAPPRCTPVWWALSQSAVEPYGEPRRDGEPFAVSLDVAGPADSLRPEAVKALVDGVVCALQAHTDRATLAQPAQRIAAMLGQPVEAIADSLCATDRAALGTRPQLVRPWGSTVQWSPDDHLCVSGRL